MSRKELRNILFVMNHFLQLVSEILTLLSLKHGHIFLCPVSMVLWISEKIMPQIMPLGSIKLSV